MRTCDNCGGALELTVDLARCESCGYAKPLTPSERAALGTTKPLYAGDRERAGDPVTDEERNA